MLKINTIKQIITPEIGTRLAGALCTARLI